MKQSITVQLDLSDLTPEAVHDAVIKEVVRHVLGYPTADEQDEFDDLVVPPAFLNTLRAEVSERVRTQVKGAVEQAVPAVVQEELSREFQPMNPWGENAGKVTTIRAMIGEYARSWLTEKVDERGQPGSYNDRKAPRLVWALKAQVDEVWKTELSSLAKDTATQIKTELADKVARDVSTTVKQLLGLK